MDRIHLNLGLSLCAFAFTTTVCLWFASNVPRSGGPADTLMMLFRYARPQDAGAWLLIVLVTAAFLAVRRGAPSHVRSRHLALGAGLVSIVGVIAAGVEIAIIELEFNRLFSGNPGWARSELMTENYAGALIAPTLGFLAGCVLLWIALLSRRKRAACP